MGAFDGNGTFVRSYNWTNDAANSIDITASRVDTEDTGFAAGLTLCVTRDGQGKMGADFLALTGATYSVGSNATPWLNGFFSGNLTTGGNLSVTGSATLGSLSLGGVAAPVVVTKSKATGTARNTVTQAADPDLQYIIPAAGIYEFRFTVFFNNASIQTGLNFTIAYSAGLDAAAGNSYYLFGQSTSTLGTKSTINSAGLSGATGSITPNVDVYLIQGSIKASATGTFSLNWAQGSVIGANSSVLAGSSLVMTKVG